MSDDATAEADPSPQLPFSEPDHTMVMQVANLGFLLERLGEDCDDLQFLRELTQNAIEAEAKNIVWDADWIALEANSTYKLCCIDDGVGMTGEEMVRHINHLSSSGRTQAIDANFGVGAKISAATRNPAGVIYQSWVNGRGNMVQLWRDPDTDQYGLKQFQLGGGRFSHIVPLNDKAKPEQIKKHGTKVTLLGKKASHDTMAAPAGVPTPSRWVNRQLGTRYFTFPKGVSVGAREGWTQPREVKDRNTVRGVMGMAEFLKKYSDSQGKVALDGCDVYWWILDNSDARRAYSLPNQGHFAALYQDELYELVTGRAGTARLQQFGVIFGSDRVVLYVEPRVGGPVRLGANTARTQLLLEGGPLPYSDWAPEFRRNMPQAIRDHMDAVIAGAEDASHQEAIQERLKSYANLYKLSRSRRGGASRDPGSATATGDVDGDEIGDAPSSKKDGKSPKKKKKRDTTGDDLASILAAEGDDLDIVEESEPEFPKTIWISERSDPPTRSENELDDRAAKYLPDDNLIQINGDFRVFVDMIRHWADKYDLDEQNGVVIAIVREWFEQALIETVLGAQQLQGDRRWSTDDINKILSEEALTAAVMQRYHVANAIKRSLGAKLGGLKVRADSVAG